MSASLDQTPASLAALWAGLRDAEPKLRIRDAAQRLGVSEAALVETLPGALRLRNDWSALLHGLTELGPVMALTRNESVVHERRGTYLDVKAEGQVGLVLGPDIDLRLFFAHWKFAWFVPADLPGASKGAIQVFDAAGTAVHKIFATDATPEGALEALARRLADPAPAPAAFEAVAPRKPGKPDAEIDAEALRDGWAGLKDTHEFFPLLRKSGAGRLQALRLAGEEWARRLPVDAASRVFTAAAETGTPIMVFVNNPGCIQIHTGPIHRVAVMGPWFNILDPDFDLHLNTGTIGQAWLVTKPTSDGDVTSVEIFDTEGELVMMLFGARKPGQQEDLGWRALAWKTAEVEAA
ncbi:hemin-degrading factor [Acetobacteraceae bacterium H6797]|nr:hemin-degrading factor [Acetobacteraceae bacterium H6797]